jgi:hypothetical protein
MKSLITLIAIATVCLFCLHGCAAGAATAGYAMRAKTADELAPDAREAIIKDAVARCRR